MKFYKTIILFFQTALLFFALLTLSSCTHITDKGSSADLPTSGSTNADSGSQVVQVPHFSSNNMEVKTFEVKDSTGKSKGWGYDIYIESRKTIHQPIIPAIPGNRAFKTEDDARRIGLFAVNKMKIEGSLPTLLVKELDSLGVTK